MTSNRLTKIYTRTGDKGQTALATGSRVSKTAPRITALGDVDELNSSIGVLNSELPESPYQTQLLEIQHWLFDLGGELASRRQSIDSRHVDQLENWIDTMNVDLPPLKNFILPGGDRDTARAHMARSICRRAERTLWLCHQTDQINSDAIRFVNRLSDYLFVLARTLGRRDNAEEVLWNPRQFSQAPPPVHNE